MLFYIWLGRIYLHIVVGSSWLVNASSDNFQERVLRISLVKFILNFIIPSLFY